MNLRKFKIFLGLSLNEKIFFLRAVLALALAKFIIFFVPLRKAAPFFGKLNGGMEDVITDTDAKAAGRVKYFLSAAINNIPWKTVCLDQALACTIMLSKRKIPFRLCLGVKKVEHEEKIMAHAWVMCGDAILIGGQVSKTYSIVAFFSKSFSGNGDRQSILQ